jgi:hypothetical protein
MYFIDLKNHINSLDVDPLTEVLVETRDYAYTTGEDACDFLIIKTMKDEEVEEEQLVGQTCVVMTYRD